MKKFLSILMVFALVLPITACGGNQNNQGGQSAQQQNAPGSGSAGPKESEPEEQKNIVIGVSLPQLDADGYSANLIGIQEAAKGYGYTVQPVDAQNSAEEQTRQIEDFITSGVGAIIFIPIDSAAMVAGVEAANAAGVPIIAMDRSVEGGKLTALIESDNATHGSQAADLILKAAEAQGKSASDLVVLELLGDQASSSGVERHDGFTKRCNELGITIATSLPTHWQADEAYSSTLDAFQANPNINAIFEASDIAMHSGVISALSQLGKKAPAGEEGHIIITSVDGGPQGVEEVKNGFIDGIAQQSLLDMGSMAVEAAADAINGKTIDNPVIQLSPVLVTIDNADSGELWTAKIAN